LAATPETKIVKLQERLERESGADGRSAEAIPITGRSLRGTASASDSSASGCREPARESSTFPESFARLPEQLMSARRKRTASLQRRLVLVRSARARAVGVMRRPRAGDTCQNSGEVSSSFACDKFSSKNKMVKFLHILLDK
jgi:hypothetical protein